MLRALLFMMLVLPVAAGAAGDDGVPFAGRSVAEIIDEYRDAGHPFAYSTNLVTADLIVTVEPDSSDPIEIVRQILRPHGLALRSQAGLHLIVRDDQPDVPKGNILLVVTTKDDDNPVTEATVSVDPVLPRAIRLAPGIYEYQAVSPGRYRFDVVAAGFETAIRIVEVGPGQTTVVSVGLDLARPEIETIAVSASRYEILSEIAASRFALDQRTIQTMPDLGEDPLRITQRLPGAAASGLSAQAHFRGGEHGEIGIMLNGHPLFDPYHVRDYQSIFSAIDSRAIEGVEVYTGGFPVRFGDRMSGLVLMESLESVSPRHTEIGISVFNTSVLTTGTQADRRWLFSARRGNLDLVIDPKFGKPSYHDVFAEFEYDYSANTTISINALFAEDRVLLLLEADPGELEQVVSDTRNAQLWVQLQNRWSDELSSKTVLSAISYDNTRDGFLSDTAKIVGTVLDRRKIERFGIRQDWTWSSSESHLVQWGLQAIFAEAHYAYASTAEYFGLQALYRNLPATLSRGLAASPNGGSYSAYFADRWKFSAKTVFEWGMRWDDQTYTDLSADSQLSPRFSMLRTLGPKTELRLSWGRYYQSQGINELQIEDGITRFWPAQRADHVIAGLRHLIRDKYALRVEMFRKDMRDVRPRFENLYDPLGLIPEIQPDRVRLDPGSAKSTGLEVSIDRSSGPLTWWASYTLSQVTDRIDDHDVPRSWDQRHALQAGVAWKHGNWDVGLAASVHSGWPATDLALIEEGVDADGEPILVAVPGARNELQYGRFASLDFRVSRRFKLRKGSLMAFFEVSNLTDRRNVCCHDWDIEEDPNGNDVLELSRDYWMPLLPAVGVLWEF